MALSSPTTPSCLLARRSRVVGVGSGPGSGDTRNAPLMPKWTRTTTSSPLSSSDTSPPANPTFAAPCAFPPAPAVAAGDGDAPRPVPLLRSATDSTAQPSPMSPPLPPSPSSSPPPSPAPAPAPEPEARAPGPSSWSSAPSSPSSLASCLGAALPPATLLRLRPPAAIPGAPGVLTASRPGPGTSLSGAPGPLVEPPTGLGPGVVGAAPVSVVSAPAAWASASFSSPSCFTTAAPAPAVAATGVVLPGAKK
mmetsp:Transcript_1010/g.2774  ORF Transcript_1010/g.2774 Transcript_1010/m.2774 type:complete len:251 (-) Transcript_1010:113-865(-)